MRVLSTSSCSVSLSLPAVLRWALGAAGLVAVWEAGKGGRRTRAHTQAQAGCQHDATEGVRAGDAAAANFARALGPSSHTRR